MLQLTRKPDYGLRLMLEVGAPTNGFIETAEAAQPSGGYEKRAEGLEGSECQRTALGEWLRPSWHWRHLPMT